MAVLRKVEEENGKMGEMGREFFLFPAVAENQNIFPFATFALLPLRFSCYSWWGKELDADEPQISQITQKGEINVTFRQKQG